MKRRNSALGSQSHGVHYDGKALVAEMCACSCSQAAREQSAPSMGLAIAFKGPPMGVGGGTSDSQAPLPKDSTAFKLVSQPRKHSKLKPVKDSPN